MRNFFFLLLLGALCPSVQAQDTFPSQEAWFLDFVDRYQDSIKAAPRSHVTFFRLNPRQTKLVILPDQEQPVFKKVRFWRKESRHGFVRERYVYKGWKRRLPMTDDRYGGPVYVSSLVLDFRRDSLLTARARLRVPVEGPSDAFFTAEIRYLRDRAITFERIMVNGRRRVLRSFWAEN